jgi:hypothetical protein
VTLTITTNTLSDWYVEPEHATLISTISDLASQGLTMKAIADSLNAQGFKSHSGRAFYSELVGALISKYRKKAKSRYVEKTIAVVNLREVKQTQKSEGKFLGGFTRYGFTVDQEKLIPDPDQQAIIKQMKVMRRRGMSLRRISKWLDRTHGVTMSHSTVATFF